MKILLSCLRTFALLLGALVFVLPLLAHAQGNPNDLENTARRIESSEAAAYQFKNEGIFGCNQISGANASAGTMAAVGGVYVPVNDAAVTLNTGILVYKECVLRPLQDRLRESALSALYKRADVAIQKGREGNARYVKNPQAEEVAVVDKTVYVTLTDKTLDALDPALKASVQRALAKYYQQARNTNTELKCSYGNNLNADIKNPTARPLDFEDLHALANPACDPFFAYLTAKDKMEARVANARAYTQMVWNWGMGFYPVTDNATDPEQETILTPSSVVRESFQQILGSPVRQLENANDIGQMIGALYAGITTQIISDNKGLSGISQSVAGQPSYLDQIARESSQGVIGAAVNAALTILNASRQVESSYLAAMNAISANLTQSINQIRGTERQCWALIVPKAQAYAAKGVCSTDTTTTPPTETCIPFKLDPRKIASATSSLAFSQQVIDSQITPLAQAAITNVQSSERALGLIDQLIAGVTNTSSLAAQRLALQQLDSLVAQKALHTQYDVVNAVKQRDDVAGSMATLVTDTAKAWGDSPDPGVGWCNINNPDIPRLWAERWKK